MPENNYQLGHAIPLATLTESGEPPKSRLKDAQKAREIVAKLIEANVGRNQADAKIKGAIDGNPPYSRSRLRGRGEAWVTNVNWMEAKASLSAALVPYYDLFAGAPYYMEVMTDWGQGTQDQFDVSRIITEEADFTLKYWLGFDYNMWAMLFDYVTYGKGFVHFADPYDFRFRHISQFKVRVPDGTLASLDDLEVLVIRESVAVHRLWKWIKDSDSANKAGWDREAVIEAIKQAIPRTAESSQYDYNYYQQQLKDHDLYEGIRSATVQLAYLYVREFNDKVSQYIVVEPGQSEPRASDGKTRPLDRFLFKKENRYKDFSEVTGAFFLEVLDGSWNGAAGLGKEIYAPMEVKNRLRCSEVDLAFMRGSIVLKPLSANALTSAQMMHLGRITIMPVDCDIQQSNVMGDVESLIAVNRDLDAMLSSNTGIYRQRMDKPEGNPRTAEEVRLQYMNQAMLGNSAVNRFYNQLDKLYYEIYRRLGEVELVGGGRGIEMAKDFRKRCKDRGVPDEALKKCKWVRAYRNIGNGSVFMRQQNIAGLLQFFPMLPESGRENFTMDAIAAFSNQTFVDRYFPQSERNKLPNDEQAQAMLENAAIKIGAPVQWTPTQNNVIHLQTHLQAGAQAAQSLQQGGNPVEVLAYLEGIGQHSAVHLQSLSADPSRKNEFKTLQNQWKQLGQIADQLRGEVQRQAQEAQEGQAQQAQAQAIQSGMDPETNLKAAEVQAKIQMQGVKTASALEQKQQKHDQALALADAKTAANIRMTREKHEAQLQTSSTE